MCSRSAAVATRLRATSRPNDPQVSRLVRWVYESVNGSFGVTTSAQIGRLMPASKPSATSPGRGGVGTTRGSAGVGWRPVPFRWVGRCAFDVRGDQPRRRGDRCWSRGRAGNVEGPAVAITRVDCSFQAVCGTVTTNDGNTRRFGFVPGADTTPRSRIRDMLDAQGLRQDQLVTFLTDGADDLAGFCEYMNHTADYALDWFHIAMRFTVLTNTATSICCTVDQDDEAVRIGQQCCDAMVTDTREQIRRAKWFLWHGNHPKALQILADATETMHGCDDSTARTKSLKMISELVGHLERNRYRLPSYAQRHLTGEPISSAPAESAVNQIIAKRMVKKQQKRWTPAGAHRLLQIRTRVLDHQLDNDITQWHHTQPIAA